MDTSVEDYLEILNWLYYQQRVPLDDAMVSVFESRGFISLEIIYWLRERAD